MSLLFNRGLAKKSLREITPVTAGFAFAIFIIEMVLAYVLPTFQKQFSAQMTQLQFLQTFIKAMVGADMSASIGPSLFTSIAWVHPVVLAMSWAQAIVTFSRVPAGEVDAGTVDILLGWPVSRVEIFLTETVVLVAGGALMMAAAFAGNTLGARFIQPEFRPELGRVGVVVINLFAIYLVAGTFAWLMGTTLARRGRAITAAFAVCLASFLLNYLAQFWKPAEKIVFLSMMRYHKPIAVLDPAGAGGTVWRDVAVLLAAALLMWAAAGFVFRRRDLISL